MGMDQGASEPGMLWGLLNGDVGACFSSHAFLHATPALEWTRVRQGPECCGNCCLATSVRAVHFHMLTHAAPSWEWTWTFSWPECCGICPQEPSKSVKADLECGPNARTPSRCSQRLEHL